MRHIAGFTLLTILSATAASAGDVYRWVDAQGQTHYADTPVPGSVLISTTDSRPPAASAPQAPATKASPPVTAADLTLQRMNQEAAQRAVNADVDKKRAEQCTQAQTRYQQSVDSRRIYKEGKDGERQYLTDSEIDQLRLNARMEMEALCKGAPAAAQPTPPAPAPETAP